MNEDYKGLVVTIPDDLGKELIEFLSLEGGMLPALILRYIRCGMMIDGGQLTLGTVDGIVIENMRDVVSLSSDTVRGS